MVVSGSARRLCELEERDMEYTMIGHLVNWSPILLLTAAVGAGLIFMCWRLVKHWERMENK